MVLPDIVALCDAVELAAIALKKTLFEKDLAKQFFPGQDLGDVAAEIKDMLLLAKMRHQAIPSHYPFKLTDRSIAFDGTDNFGLYAFLLLGHTLTFGGPKDIAELQTGFRRLFEDVVSWSFRKSGFASEVLSIPREFRGLNKKLAPALREISARFKEAAVLREDKLHPNDNDLDVDVLVSPIPGNNTHGGWPTFQIQCATGAITELQSKLQEGSATFATVWETGFSDGSRIRAVATPDDLLKLDAVHWGRLNKAGWVLDRTRIVHLSAGAFDAPLIREIEQFWKKLWNAKSDVDWQTGWQKS